MKALITGSDGFCGRHLAEWLVSRGVDVLGLDLPRVEGRSARSSERVVVPTRRGDIRDSDFVFECVRAFQPQRVYHLAGIPAEPVGWELTRALYETAVGGTLHVLEAVRSRGPEGAVVLVASSSAVYAPAAPDRLPLAETAPLLARTHYAASKLVQEELAQAYFRAHGVQVVTVRSFNLIGPGQGAEFVGSSLAQQIAAAGAAGGPLCVSVGNLDPQRDFVDVRDAVQAFWLATERGRAGEVYNVCSGTPHSVRDVLERLLLVAQVDRAAVSVVRPGTRVRTAGEILFHFGDCGKIREATGWLPTISLEQTLSDLLEDWRRRLDKERGRDGA